MPPIARFRAPEEHPWVRVIEREDLTSQAFADAQITSARALALLVLAIRAGLGETLARNKKAAPLTV